MTAQPLLQGNTEATLVVGPSWVGDMVMAQSLFKALKAGSPASEIDVLAPAWSLPLLERMPEVRAGITMPLAHGKLALGERWRIGRGLRGRYRRAIVLPNSWKSAIVPFSARIPRRTGWLGEMRYGLLNDHRALDKQRLTMTVQRFVALGVADGVPLPDLVPPSLMVREEDVAEAARALGVQKNLKRSVLALCPGAEFGPAKQWPIAHYAQLAREYEAKGWTVWLFGSEKDRLDCEAIAAGCRSAEVLAGRTTLAQAVDLMSMADAVVSNDSGLMHVAAALQRPLVAIYGSSDPGFTPPLSERHRIASLSLSCSPCFKRTCPLGTTACLQDLSVAQVNAALDELLD
jgi:heptosyltransferase-2